MADIKASSLGGVPKGATANRPASPAVGDVYYNGTLGQAEVYTSAGEWYALGAPALAPVSLSASNTPSGRGYNNGLATVSFSANSLGGIPVTYTVTSSPGGFTGTGTSSPITVAGLQSSTAYTFTNIATNSYGVSQASSASSSITATTAPQAPTIGTPTATGVSGTVSLAFTAGATGGSSITNYKYSTDGTTFYTSSNTIWTSNAQPFSWDNNSLAVPYLRFHLQQEYTVFKFNVCRK
jgi:hypothetical protein